METPKTINWQKRLLPFMAGMVGALTFFFFIASFVQLYYLHNRIEKSPELDLKPALEMMSVTTQNPEGQDNLEMASWKARVILEGHTLQRRYHQANVLLMSRIWTRYLGFVTGMILALVGAAFILGKLREPETKLESESFWKLSVTSSSPGVILAILGTTLMLTTIVTHAKIDVRDGPLYIPATVNAVQMPPTQPYPPPSDDDILNELESIGN